MQNKANQNRQRGKRFEKVVAKSIGGTRVGIFGKEDVTTSDGLWSIECKSRKAFIGEKFMAQCVRNCPDGKTPVVIVHVTGRRHEDDLVMMRFADWQDWHGTLDACRIAEEAGL